MINTIHIHTYIHTYIQDQQDKDSTLSERRTMPRRKERCSVVVVVVVVQPNSAGFESVNNNNNSNNTRQLNVINTYYYYFITLIINKNTADCRSSDAHWPLAALHTRKTRAPALTFCSGASVISALSLPNHDTASPLRNRHRINRTIQSIRLMNNDDISLPKQEKTSSVKGIIYV